MLPTVWTTTTVGELLPYVECGVGETLLLISGWGGDASSWQAELALFGGRRHCLTLEHPGLAGTPPPAGPCSTAEMADRLAAGLDALGIERVAALGMSMGGAVAQELALRHPERVEALILSGTFARLDVRAARALEASTRLLAAGDKEAALQLIYWLVFGASFHRKHLAELDALLQAGMEAAIPLEVFQYQAAACLRHDTASCLGQIACPTLITHGAEDILVPVHHARQLAEGISGAALVEFPECGHCHLWEDPVQYRKVVLEFLDAAAQ